MSLPPNIPSDRDEAIRRAAADPLLASAVRAAAAAGVGECLDVETLGLYADRVLRGEALVSARAHVEQCERCRSIVGFVEKADAGMSAPPGMWGWLTGWRWLVPAASVAAVAVLAVWVNRGPAPDAPPPAPEPSAAATGGLAAPPAPGAAASALRDGLAASAAREGSGSAALQRARPNDPLSAPPAAAERDARNAAPAREKALADAAPSLAAAGTAPRPVDEARAAAEARRQSADVGRPAPAESVAGLVSGARGAPPVAEAAATAAAPGTTAQPAAAPPVPVPPPLQPAAPAATADTRAEAAVRPAPAADGGAGEFRGQAPRMAEAVAAKRADVVSGAWRVRDGGLERQRAGAWQRVDVAGVVVVGISSPSRDVCWAVGEADILRTWNGETWTRVALPETSEPFRSISATDASTAVVTTASGVRFRTTNGGASWTRL